MVSKNGELYYRKEDREKALANNNALEYALNQGYNLVRNGSYFTLKEHDSLVFSPNGQFHWNSQGKSGKALDFIQVYEGKSEVEAVLTLAGELGYSANPVIKKSLESLPKEKRPLEIPSHAKNNEIMFAYLIKTRCISPKLVSRLVSEHKLYQSEKYNNVVMVGLDNENKPKYISLRSTNTQLEKPFKADAIGSDKSYPFKINGQKGTDTVCVFESPIEVMSYHSLCELTSSERINCDMISLGGASVLVSLDRYLKDNPHVKNIVLALNNDSNHEIDAGEKGTAQKVKAYADKYNVIIHKPHLNDWNDVLKNFKQKQLDRKIQQPTLQKPLSKQNNIER